MPLGVPGNRAAVGPNTDTELVPQSKPPGDVVFVLLFIVVLTVGVVGAALSFPAAHNEGTPGTFTANDESCEWRSGCWWSGTFVGDDGQVWIDETVQNEELREGDQIRAQRVNGELFAPGSKAWMRYLALAICSLLYPIWFVIVRFRFRRKRAT